MLICAGENKHSLQSDEKHYICKVLHPSQRSVWWSFAAVPKMCPSYPQVCARDISIIITRIYFGEGNKALIISLGDCVKCPCFGFHEAEPFCDCHPKKKNLYIIYYADLDLDAAPGSSTFAHFWRHRPHTAKSLSQITSKDDVKTHQITRCPPVNHSFVTEFPFSVKHSEDKSPLCSAFPKLSPRRLRLNGGKV